MENLEPKNVFEEKELEVKKSLIAKHKKDFAL